MTYKDTDFDLDTEFFESEKRYFEERKKVIESKASSGGNTLWWSIPSGDSLVRIAPPRPDGLKRFVKKVFRHSVPEDVTYKNYVKYKLTCPQLTHPSLSISCPLCSEIKSLSFGKGKEAKDVVNRYFARTHGVVALLVKEDPRGEEKVTLDKWAICETPTSVYKKLIEFTQITKIGNFTHPERGFNLIFSKTGEGLDTSYNVILDPDGRSPLAESLEEREALISTIPDFDTYYRSPDDEYMESLKMAALKVREIFNSKFKEHRSTNVILSSAPSFGSNVGLGETKSGKPKLKHCFGEFDSKKMHDSDRICSDCPHQVACLYESGVNPDDVLGDF